MRVIVAKGILFARAFDVGMPLLCSMCILLVTWRTWLGRAGA